MRRQIQSRKQCLEKTGSGRDPRSQDQTKDTVLPNKMEERYSQNKMDEFTVLYFIANTLRNHRVCFTSSENLC